MSRNIVYKLNTVDNSLDKLTNVTPIKENNYTDIAWFYCNWGSNTAKIKFMPQKFYELTGVNPIPSIKMRRETDPEIIEAIVPSAAQETGWSLYYFHIVSGISGIVKSNRATSYKVSFQEYAVDLTDEDYIGEYATDSSDPSVISSELSAQFPSATTLNYANVFETTDNDYKTWEYDGTDWNKQSTLYNESSLDNTLEYKETFKATTLSNDDFNTETASALALTLNVLYAEIDELNTLYGALAVTVNALEIRVTANENDKEDKSNKVTSFQATPDDTHYISEKLAKDTFDDKVDKVAGSSLVTDLEIAHLEALDTQAELDNKFDLKEDKLNKGVANGYVPLNSSTMIDSGYLPSYIDEVVEYDTYADLPATGVSSRLYIVVADETSGGNTSTYRWATTVYVQVSNTMSASEVKSLYESNNDTNAYTDTEKTKVSNIPTDTNAELDDKMDIDVYATNGETGVVDETILARKTQATIIVPLVYDTAGKFYYDLAGYALLQNTQIEFLFPNTQTDLTTPVTISLGGISGTYKAFKYEDTENEVLVKHTQNLKTEVYYNNTEWLMAGEPLLDTSFTFDSLINSTYGNGKFIKGSPKMVSVNGLSLNQLALDGDMSSLTNYAGSAATNTIADNVLSNIGNGSANYAILLQSTDSPVNVNDDYAMLGQVRVTNSDCDSITIYYDGSTGGVNKLVKTIANPTINTWYDIDIKSTLSSDATGNLKYIIYHNYADSATQNGKVMQVKQVMIFDNTNTPLHDKSASELSNIIPSYFEGPKHISNWKLTSYGVNLFDKTQYTDVDYAYKIAVKPSQDYKWAESIAYKLYDIAGNELASATSTTVTTTADTYYIAFVNSIADIDTFILNEGTVLKAYLPYDIGTQEITVDLRSVGQDVRDIAYPYNDNWWLRQYVKDDYIVSSLNGVVDGTNVTRAYIGAFTDNETWVTNDANIKIINTDGTVMPFTSSGDYDNVTEIGKFYVASNQYLYFIIAKGTSKVDAETLLAGTKIYYALAEPVTTEIPFTGNLLQESITTFEQGNDNFATSYEIELAQNVKALVTNHDTLIKQNRDDIDKNNGTHIATRLLVLGAEKINPSTSKPDYDYPNMSFLFPQNDTTEVIYAIMISPDDWVPGTPLNLKTHITQEDSGQAVMKCDYTIYKAVGGTIPSDTTYVMDSYVDDSYVSGSMPNILEDGLEIETPSDTTKAILRMKIYRDDNAYSGDLKVDAMAIHYTAYNVMKNDMS